MKVRTMLLAVLLTSNAFAKDRIVESGLTKKVISQDRSSITVTNKSKWGDLWCDFGYVKGKSYGRLKRKAREEHRIVAFTIDRGTTRTVHAKELAEIEPYMVESVCLTGGEPQN